MPNPGPNKHNTSEVLGGADNPIAHTAQATSQRTSEALESLRLKYGWYSLDPEDYLLTPSPNKDKPWITDLLDVYGKRTGNTVGIGRETARYDLGSINRIMGDTLTAHVARAGGVLPDDFFDYLVELTREYGESKGNAILHPKDAVLLAQVFAAQRHPYILKDTRSMRFYEALANFPYKHPYNPFAFEQFMGWTPKTSYFPLLGFGPEHIDSIGKIVNNDNIWNGSNSEFRRVWLSTLAHLIELLTPGNELKTAPIRFELMKRNPGISEITAHTIHSFRTAADNKVLEEMIDAIPIPKIEPQSLASYYEALLGTSGFEKTSPLLFVGNDDLTAGNRRSDFHFLYYTTVSTSEVYNPLVQPYMDALNDYTKRKPGEYDHQNRPDGNRPWERIDGEDTLNNAAEAVQRAWKNLKYSVRKEYFVVLREIRDRIQAMIDEHGADVCEGLDTVYKLNFS